MISKIVVQKCNGTLKRIFFLSALILNFLLLPEEIKAQSTRSVPETCTTLLKSLSGQSSAPGINLDFNLGYFDQLDGSRDVLIGKPVEVRFHEGYASSEELGGPFELPVQELRGVITSIESQKITVDAGQGEIVSIDRRYLKQLSLLDPKVASLERVKEWTHNKDVNVMSIIDMYKDTLKIQYDSSTAKEHLGPSSLRALENSLIKKPVIVVKNTAKGPELKLGVVESISATKVVLRDGETLIAVKRDKISDVLLPLLDTPGKFSGANFKKGIAEFDFDKNSLTSFTGGRTQELPIDDLIAHKRVAKAFESRNRENYTWVEKTKHFSGYSVDADNSVYAVFSGSYLSDPRISRPKDIFMGHEDGEVVYMAIPLGDYEKVFSKLPIDSPLTPKGNELRVGANLVGLKKTASLQSKSGAKDPEMFGTTQAVIAKFLREKEIGRLDDHSYSIEKVKVKKDGSVFLDLKVLNSKTDGDGDIYLGGKTVEMPLGNLKTYQSQLPEKSPYFFNLLSDDVITD